jgi:hypothetical protein
MSVGSENALDDPPGAGTDRDATHGADHDLAHHPELHHPQALHVAVHQTGRECHREDHRHGVVDPRLHLERAADAMLELDPAAAEYSEHRRRIRGRDDGAEQERRVPR